MKNISLISYFFIINNFIVLHTSMHVLTKKARVCLAHFLNTRHAKTRDIDLAV